jgi:MarR family transcriptional regulator for hemolysin
MLSPCLPEGVSLSNILPTAPDPMLQYDFENSLGLWIFSAAHEMSRLMNVELGAHGITVRQWEVLAHLSWRGDQSQSELADSMNIEAPTLVGVLDRMERDGWISRVPDESDRRRKLIRASEKVMPVWNKMVDCALRVRRRALRGISEDERLVLRDLLARVRANLEAPEEKAADESPISTVLPPATA